jgi:hypothetical protein
MSTNIHLEKEVLGGGEETHPKRKKKPKRKKGEFG